MTSQPMRRLTAMMSILTLLATACTGSSDVAAIEHEVVEQRTPFAADVVVPSPDSLLRIEVGLDDLSRPRYRIVRTIDGQDVTVLNDSTFGVETSLGSFATADNIRTEGDAALVVDEFALPHGKARSSTIQARQQTVRAGDLVIDLWVADSAVAFRYRIDAQASDEYIIDWERTSFAIPEASQAWLQPHDPPGVATPAYERLRNRAAAADRPGTAPQGWTFPALFETPESWLLITESALGDGAAGSHFSPAVTNGEYLLDFAGRGEGNGIGDPRPVAQGSWISPWRIIVTSPDLGDIVESNHVRHLSPSAADPEAFEWVEPGRVSWSWWSDQTSSRSAAAIEPFIDMASELGWEYSLVDANWDTFGFERLAELSDYAQARNVRLMVWYNSGGPNNAVTEAPRDIMSTRETRRAEFARLRDIGIAGVKVDFFQSDKPVTIQLYRDILSDAADFEMLVNFHGSTLPRGWQREFPNLMTMEAVRGGEIHIFDQSYHRAAPRQNTTLVFTRNVVGPMDYTPVILGDRVRRTTTNGHELALAVLFESAHQHLVDTPEAYLDQPAEVIDMLRTVPTVWDETRFIQGRPESHAVLARRNDTTWWIAAINGVDESRIASVDITALGIDPQSPMSMVCDNPEWDRLDAGTQLDPTSYDLTDGRVGERLSLDLVPHGGCLIRINAS